MIPPASRTDSGRRAEGAAAAYLEAGGWTVLARNWRGGPGELDLVAARGPVLAFVEVKRVDAYGMESLSDSVGPRKRQRVVETAKLFLSLNRQLSMMAQRFDVVAVRGEKVAAHIEGAFGERA
ncbi:MAG TPA: YraN family protein [Spirochaetales bacterium]|nr:YraN family protein [Spirochaetia bacterium]HPE35926.1 YraN family protein [Spirochaetales bacterium]